MPRSRSIWIDAKGGSARGFGADMTEIVTLKIRVGSSATHSSKLSMIQVVPKEQDGVRQFDIIIDGMLYRKQTFDTRTKEFGELKGFQIDGKKK